MLSYKTVHMNVHITLGDPPREGSPTHLCLSYLTLSYKTALKTTTTIKAIYWPPPIFQKIYGQGIFCHHNDLIGSILIRKTSSEMLRNRYWQIYTFTQFTNDKVRIHTRIARLQIFYRATKEFLETLPREITNNRNSMTLK